MRMLRCEITRWISDEPQPGWVEAKLTDASGTDWLLQDKPVIFSDRVTIAGPFPAPGMIACEIVATRTNSEGRTVVTVVTDKPWGIEALDGTTTFDVFEDQLVAVGNQAG